MHSTLLVNGGKVTVMASDCGCHSGPPVRPGTNVALSVLFDNDPPVSSAYDALSADGKVVKPLVTMFWGALFGHCVDKYGLQWLFVGPHGQGGGGGDEGGNDDRANKEDA